MKTVLLLRHADIDLGPGPVPADPELNAAGQERAQALTHVVGKAGVTAIFASEAKRTGQTVKPLADRLSLPVMKVLASDVAGLVARIRSSAAGDVVVVAGHSDTLPKIIRELGAPFAAELVSGFDNLFVVTVPPTGAAAVVNLKYGKASP